MDNFECFVPEDSSKENFDSLYSENQRVYLKCGNTEERDRDLRVSFNHYQKNIRLQLTDDDDPFFLYSLVITEDDFKTLKSQQSLLVDFEHFPKQFVKLLEQCKSDIATQGPRFLLLLEAKDDGGISQSTYLKIVEINLFKNLCHLDLQMKRGSDAEIKKLMAIQIKNLKETATSHKKELAQTSSRLNECMQHLEVKRMEGEKMHEQWEDEKRKLFFSSNAEITKGKEQLLTAKLQWQAEEDKRKQEIQSKHEAAINHLESQVAQLSAQNHILFEKNCQGESSKRERSGQLEFLEKELTASQNEIVSLRKQNSKLDLDYHEKNKLTGSLKLRIAVLEQELKDSKMVLNKQIEHLKNTNEQKGRLEKDFREKESALQRKQEALKSISDELIKANGIITKLRAENVILASKIKQRTQIALQQEELLEAKTEALILSEKAVAQMNENIQTFSYKEKNLQELLDNANEKVTAQEKHISNDKITIQYLLRQLAMGNTRHRVPSPPPTRILDIPVARLGPPPEETYFSFEKLAPFIFAADPMNPANPNRAQELAAETSASNAPPKSKIVVTSSKSATTPLHTASASALGASNALPKNVVFPSTVSATNPQPASTSAMGTSNASPFINYATYNGTRRPAPYPHPLTMSAYFPRQPK